MDDLTGIDISKYFDNLTTLQVRKYTLADKEKYITRLYLWFYSSLGLTYCINIDYSEKNRNYQYFFNQLEEYGLFLKNTIPQSKVTLYKKELFTSVKKEAATNSILFPSKPGASIALKKISEKVERKLIIYTSNQYPHFYKSTYINVNSLNDYFAGDLLYYKLTLNFKSIPSLFLFLLRYTSFLLPLSEFNIPFKFPFIVTISTNNKNPSFTDIIANYLMIYREAPYSPPKYYDINIPNDKLYKLISERPNNVLLLEAYKESEKLRSENINLLCDKFNNSPDHLCCIISDTVQFKLQSNQYINIHINDPLFENSLNCFIQTDYVMTQWFINNDGLKPEYANEPLSPHFTKYIKLYNEMYDKYRKDFNNSSIIEAISTLIAIFRLISQNVFNITLLHKKEGIEYALINYLNSLFKDINDDDSDELINKFSSVINNMILNKSLTILPNSKSNKTRTNSQYDNIIYHSNGYLIIPSETFERICSNSNIQMHQIKKALYQKGMITCSNSLYVSKLTVYPPGLSSKRINAYVIKDTIADENLIKQFIREINLTLSPVDHTSEKKNGITIGYDHKNLPIIWSYKQLSTSHILITGKSGYGKTTLIRKMLHRFHSIKEKAVVLDISGSYIHNEKLSSICCIYGKKFPVNPFAARSDESKNAFCNRIKCNISEAFELSPSASNTLYSLLSEAYTSEKGIDYDAFSVKYNEIKNKSSLLQAAQFIKEVLKNCENKTWSEFLDASDISIISIDNTFADYNVTAEFLLKDLFEYKQSIRGERLFVVIDEIQNLRGTEKSAIIKTLSQGREAGIGLIMSTQSFKTIPTKYKSMFLQAGLNIFFQPELTAVEGIAKLIHSDLSTDAISNTLKDLNKGEFLIYGSVEDKTETVVSDCVIYARSAPAKQKSECKNALKVKTSKKIQPTDLSFTILENPRIQL